jgi:hypothetical protein
MLEYKFLQRHGFWQDDGQKCLHCDLPPSLCLFDTRNLQILSQFWLLDMNLVQVGQPEQVPSIRS